MAAAALSSVYVKKTRCFPCFACSSHASKCKCSECTSSARACAVYTVTHRDYDPYKDDGSSSEPEDDGIVENYCKDCQVKFLDLDYDPFDVEYGIEEFQALWRCYIIRRWYMACHTFVRCAFRLRSMQKAPNLPHHIRARIFEFL